MILARALLEINADLDFNHRNAAEIRAHPEYVQIKYAQERELLRQSHPWLFVSQIRQLRKMYGYFFVDQQGILCLAEAAKHNLLVSFAQGVHILRCYDENWCGYYSLLEKIYEPNVRITKKFFEEKAGEMFRMKAGLYQPNPFDDMREAILFEPQEQRRFVPANRP